MKHGITAYSHHGCRCDECRAAKTVASHRYYQSHGEQKAAYRESHRQQKAKHQMAYRQENMAYYRCCEAAYRRANQEKITERKLRKQRQIRAQVIRMLGGCCVECGTSENLQIDHTDPETKNPRMKGPNPKVAAIERLSDSDRKAEMLKCQLLCSRHHGVKSAEERKRRRARGEVLKGSGR